MLNGISINRAPINSRGNIGGSKVLGVTASVGVRTTVVGVAVQRYLSSTGAGGVSATSVSLFKIKNLGAVGKCGITKVVSDMDLFKSATGQTLTYLSVNSNPNVSQSPAAILKIDGFMSVSGGAGVSNTNVTIAVQRALSANGRVTVNGFETGFFSNAYMGVSANLRVTANIGFQNQRGLSVSAGASVTAAALSVSSIRGLSANGTATVSSSDYLGKQQLLSASGTATVSASMPSLSKIKFFSVTATATVTASVSLQMNIFDLAPSQRILYVSNSPRVVYVPLEPRQSEVSQH